MPVLIWTLHLLSVRRDLQRRSRRKDGSCSAVEIIWRSTETALNADVLTARIDICKPARSCVRRALMQHSRFWLTPVPNILEEWIEL
ncbi:uncharacterized [Tachysurus ichikawai]